LDCKYAELAQARIVDEDIDAKAGAFCRVVDLLRRGGIVEVRDNADFGSLPASKLRRKGIEAVFAACRENELGAMRSQFARQRNPDACAGPGDQRPFALEVLVFAIAGSS
jgi:hypothetical protein